MHDRAECCGICPWLQVGGIVAFQLKVFVDQILCLLAVSFGFALAIAATTFVTCL